MPSHLTVAFLFFLLHYKLIIVTGSITFSVFIRTEYLRLKNKCFSVQLFSQLISWPENDNSVHKSLTLLEFFFGPIEGESQAEISSFIKICLQNEKAHIFYSLVSPWLKMARKPCTWDIISVRCIFIKISFFTVEWSLTKLPELSYCLCLP